MLQVNVTKIFIRYKKFPTFGIANVGNYFFWRSVIPVDNKSVKFLHGAALVTCLSVLLCQSGKFVCRAISVQSCRPAPCD